MAKPPLITDIQLVAIYVTDLDAAKTFYIETLGFMVRAEGHPGLLLHSAGATIYLQAGRTPPADEPNTTPEVSAVFGTRSVAAARDYLIEQGVKMVRNMN